MQVLDALEGRGSRGRPSECFRARTQDGDSGTSMTDLPSRDTVRLAIVDEIGPGRSRLMRGLELPLARREGRGAGERADRRAASGRSRGRPRPAGRRHRGSRIRLRSRCPFVRPWDSRVAPARDAWTNDRGPLAAHPGPLLPVGWDALSGSPRRVPCSMLPRGAPDRPPPHPRRPQEPEDEFESSHATSLSPTRDWPAGYGSTAHGCLLLGQETRPKHGCDKVPLTMPTTMSTRNQLTEKIVVTRLEKKLTWKALSEACGRSEVWTTSALLGQQAMGEQEAAAVGRLLDLSPTEIAWLQVPPTKGSLGGIVPTDPLIYRFHEIVEVYG